VKVGAPTRREHRAAQQIRAVGSPLQGPDPVQGHCSV